MGEGVHRPFIYVQNVKKKLKNDNNNKKKYDNEKKIDPTTIPMREVCLKFKGVSPNNSSVVNFVWSCIFLGYVDLLK